MEWKSPFSSLVKFCFAPTPYFGLSCNNCLPLLLSFLDSSCCHSVPTTPKKFYIWDLICSKCCHVIKTHTYTHTHTHTHTLSLSLFTLHLEPNMQKQNQLKHQMLKYTLRRPHAPLHFTANLHPNMQKQTTLDILNSKVYTLQCTCLPTPL